MNIHVLTLATAWGGTEVQTAALIERLVEFGHDVCLVQINHDLYANHVVYSRAQTSSIWFADGKAPDCVSGWRRLLPSLRGELCIFAKGAFEVGSLSLDRFLYKRFKRYLTIEHGLGAELPRYMNRRLAWGLLKAPGLWWYRDFFLPKYARTLWPHQIICVSAAVRNRLVYDYKASIKKALVVHNGVDTVRFRFDEQQRQQTRARWGISQRCFLFGTMGRLSPVKGFEVAIRCIAALRRSMPARDIRLILIGDGPKRDELSQLAFELGCTNSIIFAGESASPWEAYVAFDGFLMPSRTEGLPLSLLEAMACRCIPVATAVGGIPEIVISRRLGWLTRPGCDQCFTDAMAQCLILDESTRRDIQDAVRNHIAGHFNATHQLDLLVQTISGESAHSRVSAEYDSGQAFPCTHAFESVPTMS